MKTMVGRPGCIGILLTGLLVGATSAGAQAASQTLHKRATRVDLEARTKLGIHYGQQKEFAKALDEFHSVLSINPDYPPALIGMARVLSWQDRFENEVVRPLARGIIRDSVSQYGVEELVSTKRIELENSITQQLTAGLKDNDLVLEDFSPSAPSCLKT